MVKKSFKLSHKNKKNNLSRKQSQRKQLKKRSNKSKKRQKGGMTGKSGITFAAKLGAFLLEGMKESVDFDYKDESKAFSGKQAEVSGTLPFLHMNISEDEYRKILQGSREQIKSGIATVCKSKGLDTKLAKVGFQCERQSENGNKSLEQGIIDSINNRWNIRGTGREHLAKISRAMKAQVTKGIIPKESVEWANGFSQSDCEDESRKSYFGSTSGSPVASGPETSVKVEETKPWYHFWG